MTCGLTRVDGMSYAGFARRQGVQTTSSGQAEFYGATSVAMEGRLVKYLFEWLDYAVAYYLHADIRAAKAMMLREGVGKVKHLDIRALWIQQERVENGLRVRKVPGEENPADLGTKAHPVARFEKLRSMVSIVDCREIEEDKDVAT